MTVFWRAAFFLAMLGSAVSAQSAYAAGSGQCRVDDPTGTPLNVRSAPNGTILMALANGTRVDVIEEMKIGPKRWLFIARQGKRLGWAFGAYVVCKQAGDVRDAAPSQPAEQR